MDTFKLWLEATFKQSTKILKDLRQQYGVLIDTGFNGYKNAHELFDSHIQKFKSGEYQPQGFWFTHLSEILEDHIPTGKTVVDSGYREGIERLAEFLRFAKDGKSTKGEPESTLKLANDLGLTELKEELKLKNLLKKIEGHPIVAYELTKLFDERFSKLEDFLGIHPKSAYDYAFSKLNKKRWADIGKPEIEDSIGTRGYEALLYAANIMNKRWKDIGKPEVEDVIKPEFWKPYKQHFKIKE